MNKKIKWSITILLILGAIGWFLYDSSEYGIRDVFNMPEVLGPEDNNPYGIRNDVYDYVSKTEFKKWNLGPKEQMLLLNYIKLDRLMTKNFHNKEKILELDKVQTTIISCFIHLRTSDWMEKNHATDYYGPSVLLDLIGNTKDRKIIAKIIDHYFSGTLLYWFDYENDKKECNQYMERIYVE